jgi:3-deoxy-D-manno-octulosonate 8-phosphate phosphatase (KDO 8-P phosphatase)
MRVSLCFRAEGEYKEETMAGEKDLEKAKAKAKNLKLFAHDIHGVLTPNTFMVDIEGKRRYTFWHMDGFGDLSLHMNGVKPVYLDTSSIDDEGLYRAKELKLEKNYFKVTDRWAKIE